MKNYFNHLMVDSYLIYAQDEIDWPRELCTEQKVDLISQTLKYFESVEDYMKCAVLRDKIQLVLNPPKRRGRPKGSKNKK
jgi:hypothetical protein